MTVNSGEDVRAGDLGQIIRFHRKKSGLSQQRLAEMAGVGKTMVFDIEKGKLSIRFDLLCKLLEVLNIKIDLQSPLMSFYLETLDEKS